MSVLVIDFTFLVGRDCDLAFKAFAPWNPTETGSNYTSMRNRTAGKTTIVQGQN